MTQPNLCSTLVCKGRSKARGSHLSEGSRFLESRRKDVEGWEGRWWMRCCLAPQQRHVCCCTLGPRGDQCLAWRMNKHG